MSSQQGSNDDFVGQLTRHQNQLMGFILASLGSYDNASDVLQETNVVLWQKSSELRDTEDFLPWALTIARYKVLSYVRDSSREKLVFGPEVTEALTEIAARRLEALPERLAALRECLASLPESKLEVLRQRYVLDKSVSAIAEENHMPLGTVKNRLRRVRDLLSECVQRRTSGRSASIS